MARLGCGAFITAIACVTLAAQEFAARIAFDGSRACLSASSSGPAIARC